MDILHDAIRHIRNYQAANRSATLAEAYADFCTTRVLDQCERDNIGAAIDRASYFDHDEQRQKV